MRSRSDREAAGIVSTALRSLQVFRDPIVARATSGPSDFRLDEIADGPRPVSIYVQTLPIDQARLRPITRLFFQTAMQRLISAPITFSASGEPLPPHRWQTLAILDEADVLGRLPVIENSVSVALGYRVATLIAFQSVNQLKRHYGPHEAIASNCGVRILFPPAEHSDAAWISAQLGQQTLATPHRSISRPIGLLGSAGNPSETLSEQLSGRPLLFPDECLRLAKPRRTPDGLIQSPGDVLVLQSGKLPIWGRSTLYAANPELRRRATMTASAEAPDDNVVPFPVPRRIPVAARAAAIAAAILLPTLGAGTWFWEHPPAGDAIHAAGQAADALPARVATFGSLFGSGATSGAATAAPAPATLSPLAKLQQEMAERYGTPPVILPLTIPGDRDLAREGRCREAHAAGKTLSECAAPAQPIPPEQSRIGAVSGFGDSTKFEIGNGGR